MATNFRVIYAVPETGEHFLELTGTTHITSTDTAAEDAVDRTTSERRAAMRQRGLTLPVHAYITLDAPDGTNAYIRGQVLTENFDGFQPVIPGDWNR